MKMVCWNIRGMNSLFKQREIRSLIHSNNISLFGLIETRVQQENSIQIANDLLRGWRYVFNYNYHPNVGYGFSGNLISWMCLSC